MSLSKRTTDDLMLYAFVRGVQIAMPTVSVVRAIERFQKEFGHACQDCDVNALEQRYVRMRTDHLNDQKTPE